MRPANDDPARSATPIYDALYAEYRRLFRALPGDRTGEEELRFIGFQPWTPDSESGQREWPSPRRGTGGHGPQRGDAPALPPASAASQPAYGNRMRER